MITTADCKRAICNRLKEFLASHPEGDRRFLQDYTAEGVWKRISKTRDSNGNIFRVFDAPMCGDGQVTVVEREGSIVNVKWVESSGPAAFDFMQNNGPSDFEAKPAENTPKPGNWGSFA